MQVCFEYLVGKTETIVVNGKEFVHREVEKVFTPWVEGEPVVVSLKIFPVVTRLFS
jgi:hypothetical protein